MKSENLPLIFDIRHFTLDDGPGIRTTVFLKGCPLSCIWCHNPESLSAQKEIAFYDHLCMKCGECVTACPEGAVNPLLKQRIDRNRCTACEVCTEACPTTALKPVGRYYPPDELIQILLKDKIFYDVSKGGVTFSGGEPTLFMDYVRPAMRELKRNAVHIALQTSGMFDLPEFRTKLLPYIDLIFYDLKIFDPEKHKKFTGVDNHRILSNLAILAKESNVEIIPRTPLVPDITDTPENLKQIERFLKALGIPAFQCLAYNSGGDEKRTAIGKSINRSPDAFLLPLKK